MPLYIIKKKITAYLTVDCKDFDEALCWGDYIVATLEDKDGNPVHPDDIDDFSASVNPDETVIELFDEE